jgi:hypothetical protein
MKRSSTIFAASLLSAFVLTSAGSAFAQDPSSTQEPDQQQSEPSIVQPQQTPDQAPKPAGRGARFGDDTDAVTDAGVPITPDSSPLTGVQVATLGSQAQRHSYFVPGFQYGNFLRSSTQEAPQVPDWNTTSFVAGNVSLLQQWQHAQLAMNYTGGGTFSTDKLQGNSYYQQMELQQVFDMRHAKISLIDQFDYLPQADFGFGAASPLAIAGIGGPLGPSLPALQSNYQPNQSIFTTIGSRYSNSGTAQIEYFVSPRSQITVSGSYGILRFLESGNVESNDAILSVGYDYQVSRRDTLGILYRYTDYRYLGNPQAIEDHVAQIAYGHKITGRATLQIFVGPEITDFRIPLNGESQRVSVAGGGNFTYEVSHTNLSLIYNHSVSGGSGAFTGATTDTISGTVVRKLNRVYNGNISFGYARNRSLQNNTVVSLNQPIVNSWFAGAGVDRNLGRTATGSLAYTAFLESSTQGCQVGSCTSYLQHQISLSLQWHMHPVVME